MLTLAFGQMKLDPVVFWNMTLTEWTAAQRGFFEAEDRRGRGEWERARWMAFMFLQPYDSKRRINKVTDIARFDWEKEDSEVMNQQEMDAMARKLGYYYKDGKYTN